MTDIQTFDPEGRAIPYIVEGEGPVPLVLIPEPGQDALGVVGHYLAEEAGLHVIRIGYRPDAEGTLSLDDRAADVIAVIDHLGLDHTWIGGHGYGGTSPGRPSPPIPTVRTDSFCWVWRMPTSRFLPSSPCSSSRRRRTR